MRKLKIKIDFEIKNIEISIIIIIIIPAISQLAIHILRYWAICWAMALDASDFLG